MNLCSDGHDEVCFEGRNCPVCEVAKEKDKEIDSLEGEISNLKDEIRDLQSNQ